MAIVEITSKEHFQTVLQDAKLPVVVDFWAPWCSPCELMAGEVETVAGHMAENAVFATVNIEERKDIALLQEVEGVPTVVVYSQGEEIDRIAGFKKAEALEALLKRIISQSDN